MAISMLKIRRPLGRLIFNMGIAIPGKTVFLIETAPSELLIKIQLFSFKKCIWKCNCVVIKMVAILSPPQYVTTAKYNMIWHRVWYWRGHNVPQNWNLQLKFHISHLELRFEVLVTGCLLWVFWGKIDRVQFYSIGFIETHTLPVEFPLSSSHQYWGKRSLNIPPPHHC